jgi:hypothetical protein
MITFLGSSMEIQVEDSATALTCTSHAFLENECRFSQTELLSYFYEVKVKKARRKQQNNR